MTHNKDMSNEDTKNTLAALLAVLAEEQEKRRKASEQGKPEAPKDRIKPFTPRRAEEALAEHRKREGWYNELAVEQVSRESTEDRQRYYYPPTIPEDISNLIIYAASRGIIDLDRDSVARSLTDAKEIRKLIAYGRMDAAELPLLHYRIERLLGVNQTENPPDGRAMLSSLAYYHRGQRIKLEEILQEALVGIEEDFQYGSLSASDVITYKAEVQRIIQQYL